MIQKIIEAVSANELPYRLDAPSGLLANLAEKENLMVLHLTNWTGNKFEQPWINEYYLAPVENVRVLIQIPEHKRIKSVSLLVEADYEQKNGQKIGSFFTKSRNLPGDNG